MLCVTLSQYACTKGVIVLGFNTFLQSLTAEALSEQLFVFTCAAQKVDLAAQGTLPTDAQHLDSLIHDYSSASLSTPRFVYTVDSLWPTIQEHGNFQDIFSLRITFERRAAMLANGVAWRWLYHDCAMRVDALSSRLQHDALSLCDTIDWLEMLIRDIHKVFRSRKPTTLHTICYLPEIQDPNQTWAVQGARKAHLDGLADLVHMEVINVLTQWLHFPTTTHRLAAHFIVRLVQITGNIDVLLFKSVWMAHQNIKAIILDDTR
ncbi:hypothetical protein V8D89_006624 [Ganoderma adspersum]